MKAVPVNFNTEHKAILGICKMILEHESRKIAIDPDKFDKPITSLRTAVDNDSVLDKESTSYNDIFDTFRLARFNASTCTNDHLYTRLQESYDGGSLFFIVNHHFVYNPNFAKFRDNMINVFFH